eukprot:9600707-Lingulodinium_polyedra.AAC.1
MLRQIRVPRHKTLWLAKRDLSNCFYLFEVEKERLPRQVIGPRIPRSWLARLDAVELDWSTDFEA